VVLSADLVIDSVTSPALADLGTTIAVSWVGRNAGDEATGGEFGWSDGLYLSADDVLDENDLYLGEFYADRVNPVLAAGETYEIFAQIYLPFDATLGTGEYRLIVSADLGGSEAEGDEGNNTRVSGAMGVSVPTLPDLTVGEINAGALGRFGEDFSISWTITNSGLGSTFVDVTDAVYLSTDDVLDTYDLWVDVSQITLPAGPLALGESITIEATARLPIDSALGAGSYRLIVVADGYSMQAETDEENNTLASSPIEVSLATPPDLIVEIVSAESRDRDYRDKYLDYQSAGVTEYIIIDPAYQTIDLHRLEGGKYVPVVPENGALSSSVLPGFVLRAEWLKQSPLPDPSTLP